VVRPGASTEDFAETFAVWLKPNSPWRREYVGWPAYGKLQYIDQLAEEIGALKPAIADRSTIEDVTHETGTLREHYEQKLARYRLPRRSGADELLLKVFRDGARNRTAPKAASVLRDMRGAVAPADPAIGRVQRVPGAPSVAADDRTLRSVESLRARFTARLRAELLWVVARLAESYEERKLPRVAL